VAVEVGIGLFVKPVSKPKTFCEVGEVRVVQQVGKLKAESRNGGGLRQGEEARKGVGR
jgi:hypothetical protein